MMKCAAVNLPGVKHSALGFQPSGALPHRFNLQNLRINPGFDPTHNRREHHPNREELILMIVSTHRAISALVLTVFLICATPFANATPQPAAINSAGIPDQIADRIVGQSAFNQNAASTTSNTLTNPAGVAIAPNGRLFVVDYGNNRVLSWPSAANYTTGQAADLVLGQANFTSNGTTQMNGPEAIVIDSTNRVYIADTSNHRVLFFNPPFSNGMPASGQFGSNGASAILENKFLFTRGLALDPQENLFVVDEFNNRVLVYTNPRTTDTTPDAQITGLNEPRGVASDSAGNIYVTDSRNDKVQIYRTPVASNNFVADLTLGSSEAGARPNCDTQLTATASASTMDCPIDIAVDANTTVYVSDIYNHRILAYYNPLTTDILPDSVFGQANFTGAQNNRGGTISTVSLSVPLGMTFDQTGALYVADIDNNRVIVFKQAPAQLSNTNLIQNGDAEANPGSSNTTSFAPASWEIEVGDLAATQYGAAGGYPAIGDPGPAQRGNSFFNGGLGKPTIASQQVDITTLAPNVDAGNVTYSAAGYFGGYTNQGDNAYLEINFLRANGSLIEQFQLGPVLAADRGDQTGLFLRNKNATVPVGTRLIAFRLHMEYASGTITDGYADNLSMALAILAIPPPPPTEYRTFLPFVQKS